MLTPAEQLRFFAEKAAQSLAFADAQARAGQPLALFNYSSASESHFSRALIGWRTGLILPMTDLSAASDIGDRAVAYLRARDLGVERYGFDPRASAYAGLLLGRVVAAADEMARYRAVPRPRGVTLADACDAWLISALTGGPVGDGPAQAQQLTAQKRTRLWGETVGTYFELLRIDPTDIGRATELTERAIELFGQRRGNGYIGGGKQYYGGDLDNDLVVDFHLAAVWRVRAWDPAPLSDVARLHATLPTATTTLRTVADAG